MSKSSADEDKMRIHLWLERGTRSRSPVSGNERG